MGELLQHLLAKVHQCSLKTCLLVRLCESKILLFDYSIQAVYHVPTCSLPRKTQFVKY